MTSKYQKGGRGLGGKRCNRKSVSLSNEYLIKLEHLSVSCDLPPATLMSILIETCLDSPNLVAKLQDRFNKNPNYRVYPVIENGKVIY